MKAHNRLQLRKYYSTLFLRQTKAKIDSYDKNYLGNTPNTGKI